MIKKCDSELLNHHFPREDWEDLFWGFTDYSRQPYADLSPLGAEDEIVLGIYSQQGGCLFGVCKKRMDKYAYFEYICIPRGGLWRVLIYVSLRTIAAAF